MQELHEYKEKNGKKWKEVAEDIGITYRGLKYIIDGKRKPSKSVVKLIEVEFDSGQTCTFHSRVSETGGISESFASDLRNILNIDGTDKFGALSQEAM